MAQGEDSGIRVASCAGFALRKLRRTDRPSEHVSGEALRSTLERADVLHSLGQR